MSINQHSSHCQELVTVITSSLSSLQRDYADPAALPLHLQLQPEQLALLAVAWESPNPKGIITGTVRKKDEQGLLDLLTAWQQTLAPADTWHIVSGKVTPQEQLGDITTAFTTALHFLYNNVPHHHYIFPFHTPSLTLPDPASYRRELQVLHTGQTASRAQLLTSLSAAGYIRYTEAIEHGGFRVRGEQVDVYHPIFIGPVTITFYGSVIESIIQHHGRRSQTLTACAVPPMRFPAHSATLTDIITPLALFVPTQSIDIGQQAQVVYNALHPAIDFPWQTGAQDPDARPASPGFVVYENRDRVSAYVKDHNLARAILCRAPLAKIPVQLYSSKHFILTEGALFPPDQNEKKAVTYEQGLALLAELREGQPAVHDDHGIGIYEGLATRRINDIEREYLILRYDAGDLLSVPVEFAHKVTAYVGDRTPLLHRLGGILWAAARRRAQHDAEAFARELLTIARARQGQPRPPYGIDPALETTLDASFPYELTPDQEAAWQAVQYDLQQSQPMDRLIVGDVGFGKTEIALRAAAHVVANGRQVALLAPTTLLVQQHADTLRSRLPGLASVIGVLSRFTTAANAKMIREKISTGEIKIAIGTHALLARSTHWHSLGLAIIDEEQRFGVTHKEHFKKLRATVDILSLSATPIPRTLSMTLAGLKELSVISTPPQGRRSIQTHVGPDHEHLIAAAIQREHQRGGQVYVVTPKIRALASLARWLALLAPKATIGIVHGQLPSQQLANLMHAFDGGSINLLVSSSIIENGLDVPNANTLIVMRATHFGLAELYQLRGRIGRRARQGYAYFFYNQQELTHVQRQRLAALTESTRLGSGWSLAQRDLEIRGAGNVLGAQQSGSVNAVGAQLYLDMIREALETTGDMTRHRQATEVHLPITAIIPSTYIADVAERIHFYQLLSRASTVAKLQSGMHELTMRYGPAPAPLENLFLLLTLQLVGAAQGIREISWRNITPTDEAPYSRLQIDAHNLPQLIAPLSALGNWEVRGHLLTLDLDEITPAFIRKLVTVLQV